ncbi:MAG: protein kinase, partial [Planctomycetes bacterium]|nr:protein kinase [Planctomycetota bacterium]
QQLRLLEIFVDLCQSVAYAHSRGVIHRDLKPDNVMLGEYGETIVLDWGLAKVMGHPELPGGHSPSGAPSYVHVTPAGRGSETLRGAVMGAPPYMPPEVAEGRIDEVDERTDVYLLSATLYEILTGRPPRQGSSHEEMIELARTVPPVPPRQLNRAVPRALEAICLKAMARRKQDRYATAKALAEDVQRYLAGEPVTAYAESFLERSWRWAKRHRRGLGYAAVAGVAISLSWLAFSKVREAEKERQVAELEAQQLQLKDQQRDQVNKFRRKVEQAYFYAASTEPVAEHAPSYDPRQGEAAGQQALEIADQWGDQLEELTLQDEHKPLKEELYGLLLLIVQLRTGQPAAESETTQETRTVLDLLDRAAALREPTRSFHRLRAECLRRLGEQSQAAEAERQEIDTDPSAVDHFLLGEQYRVQAARTASTLADQPDWQPVWQPDSGKLEKAISEYRQALMADPEHYWSQFQLGRCYMGLGRLAQAVEALGTCVALRPQSPWGYSARGLALGAGPRDKDASDPIEDLTRAIELAPGFRPSRLNRGVLYWLRRDYDRALQDFDAVLEPPDSQRLIEGAYYRAQVYIEQAKYVEPDKLSKAMDDLDSVINEKQTFSPAYHQRARVHFLRGDKEKGTEDLNTYLAMTGREGFDADSARAFYDRGRLLRRLARKPPKGPRTALFEAAEAELRKAIDRDGKSAEFFDELGAVQEKLEKGAAAIAAYSEGLRLAPSDMLLLMKLLEKRGWAYAQPRDQLDKGIADFEAIMRLDPHSERERVLQASAHTGAAWVHACRGEERAAQQEAAWALSAMRNESHWGIPFNLAGVYAELSKTKSKPEYQKLALAMLSTAADLAKRASAVGSLLQQMKTDKALKPLQDLTEFKKQIESLEPPK